MTQTWHDLLFAHWPVERRQLREAVPDEFELDLFDSEAIPGGQWNDRIFPHRALLLVPPGSPRQAVSIGNHHPPWPLQPAEAQFSGNTMADAAGLFLPATKPLLHFSKRQDMVAWVPRAFKTV